MLEYLAGKQQADIDLAEVRKWKLGVIEKPSWSDSPALKSYWQQTDSIVVNNRVQYRSFILGGRRSDELQFLAPISLQPTLLELARADARDT
jgi:hypothetical protein